MTLHFLSQGSSMQEIAWAYYVGKTTVHCIIKETCKILWDVLSPTYLKPPEENNWLEIIKGFYERWNMPNCIGALDGKHINIQAPRFSGSDYFSYKKTFSLVLMAICDSKYQFTLVDIGATGSMHDSRIFQNSAFGSAIMENNAEAIKIPTDQCLPHSDNILTPCFFVADQAFPLHKHIMRPYHGERLSHEKQIFNYRLSRARRVIENTFGILVQQWRILRKPIIGNIDTCESIVKAAIVLHNFVQRREEGLSLNNRRYCPTGYTDYYDSDGNLHLGRWRDDAPNFTNIQRLVSNNSSQIVRSIRDTLSRYFKSAFGAVSWENESVIRGSEP